MGLFDSIGDIFEDAVDFIAPIAAPVASAVGGFFGVPQLGGIFGGNTNWGDIGKFGSAAYNAYSGYQQFQNQQDQLSWQRNFYDQQLRQGVISQEQFDQQLQKQIAFGQETNAQNLAEAQRNRDFQERLSSTAHQREIADYKKAGLNPILSGTGGMGSSSPAGSMARVENAYEGTAGDVNNARKIRDVEMANIAIQAQRLKNETTLTNSQALNQRAQAYNQSQQGDLVELEKLNKMASTTSLKWDEVVKMGQSSKLYEEKLLLEIEQKYRQGQIDLNTAQRLLTQAQTRFQDQSTHSRTSSAEFLHRYGDWGEAAKIWRDAADGLGEFTPKFHIPKGGKRK